MNEYKSIKDRIFREYTLLSPEEITQKDFFEVLSLFTDIKDPNQLFNQYQKFEELLGEDIDILRQRSDNGCALAALVKLICDSAGIIMSKNMSSLTDNIPSSSDIENNLSISAHARRTSRYLSSVSKENIHRICIRLAQKVYDPMRETVWFTCLDSKNRIVGEHCLGKGGFGNSPVNIRKLISISLKSDASALIVAHNHPDESPTPSQSDLEVTEHLDRICSYLNINLIDHIIIISDKYISIKKPRLYSSNEKYDISKGSETRPEYYALTDNVIDSFDENTEKRDNEDNKSDFFDMGSTMKDDFDDNDVYKFFSGSYPIFTDESDTTWIPKDADVLDYSDEGEIDCGNISNVEAFKKFIEEQNIQ